ncbi:MAG: permease [Planctomycetes bacterium GWF2_41_51]|nr:MAG: permease [Planctomycetes bacterium GWF2_41_51]HBG28456.1 permease [Phycisphaerales bacterium]
MSNVPLYLLLGLCAGILSGLIGIGGATVIIPALVFLFGMTQYMAQGTTLAMMVPPIGILAAWMYYQKGYVDVKIAGLMCIGFLIGGLLGAKLAVGIPEHLLKKIFGIFLLIISMRMILGK